jgi:hypothetical protein
VCVYFLKHGLPVHPCTCDADSSLFAHLNRTRLADRLNLPLIIIGAAAILLAGILGVLWHLRRAKGGGVVSTPSNELFLPVSLASPDSDASSGPMAAFMPLGTATSGSAAAYAQSAASGPGSAATDWAFGSVTGMLPTSADRSGAVGPASRDSALRPFQVSQVIIPANVQ